MKYYTNVTKVYSLDNEKKLEEGKLGSRNANYVKTVIIGRVNKSIKYLDIYTCDNSLSIISRIVCYSRKDLELCINKLLSNFDIDEIDFSTLSCVLIY